MDRAIYNVLLWDGGSRKVAVQPNCKARALFNAVCDKAALTDTGRHVFGLVQIPQSEADKTSSQGSPARAPHPQPESWMNLGGLLLDQLKQKHFIMLKARLFKRMTEKDFNRAAEHYLYSQIQSDVVAGRLFTEEAGSTRLAVYQIQAQFGNHMPIKHRPGFLDDCGGHQAFLPPHICALDVTGKGDDPDGDTEEERKSKYWQRRLFTVHKELKGLGQDLAEKFYLKLAMLVPSCGSNPMPVKNTMDGKDYLIGADEGGLLMLEGAKKDTGNRIWVFLPFESIKWHALTHGGAILEMDKVDGKKMLFTGQRERLKTMCDLLSDYRALAEWRILEKEKDADEAMEEIQIDVDEEEKNAALAKEKAKTGDGVLDEVDEITAQLKSLHAGLSETSLASDDVAEVPLASNDFDIDLGGLDDALGALDMAFGGPVVETATEVESSAPVTAPTEPAKPKRIRIEKRLVRQDEAAELRRSLRKRLAGLPPPEHFEPPLAPEERSFHQPWVSRLADFKRCYLTACRIVDGIDPRPSILTAIDTAMDTLSPDGAQLNEIDLTDLTTNAKDHLHAISDAVHKCFSEVNPDLFSALHRKSPKYALNFTVGDLKLTGSKGILSKEAKSESFDSLEDLGEILKLGKVRALVLSNIGLGGDPEASNGLTMLLRDLLTQHTAAVTFGELEDLDLSENNLKSSEVVPIINTFKAWSERETQKSTAQKKRPPNPPPLMTLDVHDNQLDDDFADAIVFMLHRPDSRLCSLDINGNRMSDYTLQEFADALQRNMAPKLNKVNISANRFGGKMAAEFVQMLWERTLLEELRMNNLDLGQDFAAVLAFLMGKPQAHLTTFGLQKCSFNKKGTKSILAALGTNPMLEILNLSNNTIDNAGGEAFRDAMVQNKRLVSVTFMQCDLDKRSCMRIIEGICLGRSLRSLDLSYNKIVDKNHLRKMCEECNHLETISLSGNSIGKEGIKVLADFVKLNPRLKKLFIDTCDLKDLDGITFMDGMSYNKNIEQLSMRSNKFTEKGIIEMVNQLVAEKRNKGYLKKWDMGDNNISWPNPGLTKHAVSSVHPATVINLTVE